MLIEASGTKFARTFGEGMMLHRGWGFALSAHDLPGVTDARAEL